MKEVKRSPAKSLKGPKRVLIVKGILNQVVEGLVGR